MDYSTLTRKLVADAINKRLPGLTTEVVFHYITGPGEFNVDTGLYENQTEDSDPIKVVAARPTMKDVEEYNVVSTSRKLIVPGQSLTIVPDTTTTVTMGGKNWTVCKVVEVPGDSAVFVFVEKT